MSRRGIASGIAFVVLVAYLALVTLGAQYAIHPPGLLYDLWYSAVPLIVSVLLCFLIGVYTGRWWAVVAALTPVAVLGLLELAGHVAPWHEAGPPLTQHSFVFWVSTVFWFWAIPIAMGVALRRGLGPRGVSTAAG